MSATVQMICRVCGKEKEYQWKQFTKWLRTNAGRSPEDYLCHNCTTAERNRTHGKSKTALYVHWQSMFVRTKGQGQPENEKYYVAKGIKVCAKWSEFEEFEKWALLNGFKENSQLVLHRKNGNRNYEPRNCEWMTKSEHTTLHHQGMKYGKTIDRETKKPA